MKKKKIIVAAAALLLLLSYLLATYLPTPTTRWRRSVCRVTARSCYVLPVGTGDTLFLPVVTDSENTAAICADSLKNNVETSGVFVSRAGHVVATDSLILAVHDSLCGEQLHKRLIAIDTLLRKKSEAQHSELKELDYYADTHTAIDDGYNEVMAYREEMKKRSSQTDSTLLLTIKALEIKQPVALRRTHYQLLCPDGLMSDSTTHTHPQLLERVRRNGLLLLQSSEGRLPDGASRLSVHRFGTYAAGRRLVAFNDFGALTAADSAEVLFSGDTLLPTAEGGAWVNASGQLCGIERQGRRATSWQIAKLLREEHAWPVWWWTNTMAAVKSLFSSTNNKRAEKTQKNAVSTSSHRQSLKCVRTVLPDSSLYEGLCSTDPKTSSVIRNGYGRLTLTDGTVYEGVWQTDTLPCGLRVDSTGRYVGTFNAKLQRHGTGTYTGTAPDGKGTTGAFYRGQWKEDLRDGHGFSSQAGRIVRCGEWRNDRFKGERMVYTADRVYGIDISRYQHGKGRRYIPIHWDRLRITSLGNGRRVAGSVDYPVSFVYIKATEGRTLFNKHYSADLRQARRHNIAAGSYHFFSPTSTGAQQAAWFLKMAWVAAGDLPPVLDLEPSEKQVRQMGGDAAMFAQVLVWLQTVEKARGKKPVLYVGQQFVNNHLRNAPAALRGYDVWIARYGEYKPYVRLLHWQLTPYGRVRGITGDVDINVFNGTKAQFAKYLNEHTNK